MASIGQIVAGWWSDRRESKAQAQRVRRRRTIERARQGGEVQRPLWY